VIDSVGDDDSEGAGCLGGMLQSQFQQALYARVHQRPMVIKNIRQVDTGGAGGRVVVSFRSADIWAKCCSRDRVFGRPRARISSASSSEESFGLLAPNSSFTWPGDLDDGGVGLILVFFSCGCDALEGFVSVAPGRGGIGVPCRLIRSEDRVGAVANKATPPRVSGIGDDAPEGVGVGLTEECLGA